MNRRNRSGRLGQALTATRNLWNQAFANLKNSGTIAALMAHGEIEHAPHSGKSIIFYRSLVPLRNSSVAVLAETYRRCLKLALANPQETGLNPHEWAWSQIQPAVSVTFEWLRDWYILACDGENRYVRRSEPIEFVPGQTVSSSISLTVSPCPSPKNWRAPVWLFGISLAHFGIGLLKPKHIPATDSDQKLGPALTRLIIKGARRKLLWELGDAIRTVLNEEVSAAGTIPSDLVRTQSRKPNKRKGWEQRLKLYGIIQKVLGDNPRLEGMGFCAELDKRHAPPLLDWTERGEWSKRGMTWKEAWRIPALRRKIRRVRQEAMKYR
jgi:hypothetical protein